MAVNFSTDNSSFMLINESILPSWQSINDHDIEKSYELYKCRDWILSHNYEKTALQFPDDQLRHSFTVFQWLAKETRRRFYVLGDTSFGSCCVDEIAAEHVAADSIIHFGRTCLSLTTRLPALYIFPREPVDVESVVNECISLCQDFENIIVFYDVVFHYAIDEVQAHLKSNFEEVIIPSLNISSNPDSAVEKLSSNRVNGIVIYKCGRTVKLKPNTSLEDYCIFYIGEESLTQTNIFLTFNKNACFSYSPVKRRAVRDSINTNTLLKRRYYLVEKVKDANIIGILVGTLGVKEYLSVINHLKNIIKVAGKRSYTLIVGKPNPAKLSNFAEIDIYVLVACAENTLLQSKDYYRPIVTPFELEMALNKTRIWDGSYITDFTQLIKGGDCYIPQEEWTEEEQQDVSLISGNVRSFGLHKEDIYQVSETADVQSLEVRNEMKVAPLHNNAAGSHLVSRSWRGLEQKLGETPVFDAIEGRCGIAASYESEPK